MAYTFKLALGQSIGTSLCEPDLVETARAALAKAQAKGVKFLLPVDNMIVEHLDFGAKTVSPGKWEIFTHGGRKSTGIDAVEFARTVVAKGAGEILLTSMDRDGTKGGYNLPLTRAISDAVSIPVIASGGVGTLDHLVEGITEGHASAVLAASIFHFGTYTIGQAKAHMAAAGIPVRLQ